jgi:hypothetical protein
LWAIIIESVRLLKLESLFFSLSEKKKHLRLKLGQYFANRQFKTPGASLLWDPVAPTAGRWPQGRAPTQSISYDEAA